MSTHLTPALLAELEQRLERHEAAIAHLMQYFPPPADPIHEGRLHEILQALVDQAQAIFPGRTVTGTAAPMHDRETTAVHHLLLRVAGGWEEFDATDFTERAFQLYHYAATDLSPEEFQAILLSVEPHG
jgi:hypothetical protein